MHTVTGAMVSNSRHYMCAHMYVYVSMYVNLHNIICTLYVLYCECIVCVPAYCDCKCSKYSLHMNIEVFMGIQKHVCT